MSLFDWIIVCRRPLPVNPQYPWRLVREATSRKLETRRCKKSTVKNLTVAAIVASTFQSRLPRGSRRAPTQPLHHERRLRDSLSAPSGKPLDEKIGLAWIFKAGNSPNAGGGRQAARRRGTRREPTFQGRRARLPRTRATRLLRQLTDER